MKEFSDRNGIGLSSEIAIMTIRKNQSYFGHVIKKGNSYIAHGQIGENNEYESFEDVMKSLSGFNLSIDEDIFWEN